MFGDQGFGREIREGRGTGIKQNTNTGEMLLLMVYSLLTGSRQYRFKKYTCYRNFFKGIDNVFCNPKFTVIKES